MLTIPVVRRAIDHLRRPFIQRLILLVVSALLAMSLVYTINVLVLPPSVHEVASSVSRQSAPPTSTVHLEATRIQGFKPSTYTDGLSATEKHERKRRLV